MLMQEVNNSVLSYQSIPMFKQVKPTWTVLPNVQLNSDSSGKCPVGLDWPTYKHTSSRFNLKCYNIAISECNGMILLIQRK